MSAATSEFLKINIVKIMKIWEDRMRAEMEVAPEIRAFALWNSLPEYLKELADDLSTNQEAIMPISESNTPMSSGTKHGLVRAENSNCTIKQLISEYRILRKTIFEVIEAEIKLSNFERDIIIDSIEEAVNNAATEFSDYLKTAQEVFSRTLIHDLRSPLALAVFSVGMFQSVTENDAHNQKVQARMYAALERINLMFGRLLDYSSIKAGQGLTLDIEQVDMCELIRKITDELNFSSSNRFLVKIPPTLIGFWDIRGVTSILENLATNALKYSDAHTAIVISAGIEKEWVKIVVHNDGNAIPSEDQASLFEQFHRAKNNKKESGWGLGLTIVRSIAESHGGSVSVESAKNFGTSFTVMLPINHREKIKSPFLQPAS